MLNDNKNRWDSSGDMEVFGRRGDDMVRDMLQMIYEQMQWKQSGELVSDYLFMKKWEKSTMVGNTEG